MMWPMRHAQALEIIAQHERELRDLGVRSLSFFGSVARDVQEQLEAFLGCKVDLVTPGGLRPELRQGILAEGVRAA